MKQCRTCGTEFKLRDPLDNAYDIRVHLRMNPTHSIEVVRR